MSTAEQTKITNEYVQEVCGSSWGTSSYYKRSGIAGFVYTDGVMHVQTQLNAYWLVDMIVSYIPTVIKDFKNTKNTFYTVQLDVNEDSTADFTINKEGYDKDDNYIDIPIVVQHVPYTDLPKTQIKMFLELANYNPITFCALMPTEH